MLEQARAEIRRCWGDTPPPIYDPFSGGCSITLEAQRLGVPARASDLNPVPVLIGKATIEFPPQFHNQPPQHPELKKQPSYRGAYRAKPQPQGPRGACAAYVDLLAVQQGQEEGMA